MSSRYSIWRTAVAQIRLPPQSQAIASRSAVVQKAVGPMRASELSGAYEDVHLAR